MIRQVVTLIAAGAFVASLAAPALATSTAPAAPKADAPKMDKMDKMDKAAKPAKTKAATGKIKKITDAELVVLVTPKGKDAEEVTFILEKETKIMKGGKVVAVKDVMEAETVTVTYAEMDGKKTAKSVSSKGAAAPAAAKKGS
jgi:hypothetical protein